MTDPKPMPRAAIIAAGWILALAAVAGLGGGLIRNLKGVGGAGDDTGEIVAPVKAANAQPLTSPPVTEADVRRWAREEVLATQAARAPKKPADDADDDNGPDDAKPPTPPPSTTPAAPAASAPGTVTTPKPATQTGPAIPF